MGDPEFNPIWKQPVATLAEQRLSLDAVEKGTREEDGFIGLLNRFNDPRIHSAVVCASVSCPDLALEAYTAENVEALLDLRTRAWLGKKSN